GGRPRQLSGDYAWAFAHPGPADRNVSVADLVVEADSKLLTQASPADIPDPMLLAARDLMAMRRDPSSKDADAGLIKYDDLAAQRAAFAGEPALFEFLLAAHRFYVEADPAGALARLGTAAPSGPMNDLAFSRLVLRGMALEARGERAEARALWLQMIPLARPAFQRPLLDHPGSAGARDPAEERCAAGVAGPAGEGRRLRPRAPHRALHVALQGRDAWPLRRLRGRCGAGSPVR